MNALKRYTTTLFCSAGFLAASFLAGCGGGGDQGRDPILGLPAADLVTLAVTPATASVGIGGARAFVATASYSDGSSRDVTVGSAWTSATPAVATVSATTGVAAGASVGSSVITAAFGSKTASATLTVVPVALTAIAVLPANPSIGGGATQQFTAMRTFNNGSTSDITATSTFASATPAVATVNATTGLAVGLTAGKSLITATFGALSGSTTLTVTAAVVSSIAVTPQAPSVQAGATRQLAVVASYSDGTTVDVTNTTAFSSATPAAATVGAATGLVTGVAGGSSVVTAAFGGKTATTTVTVPSVTLSSIAVTPATTSVAVGGTQQFVATGTYSDSSTAIITTSANWTSGTIANGTTTITATAGGKSGSAVLTIAAAAPPPAAGLNLGRATSFGVLAGTSITNNSGGTTLVTGDVGSPSQTTPPPVAPGFVNLTSGAVLDGALADLQVAITDGNGRTCDVNFPSGIDLGGLTLAPGVYCYAGAINITGTLTLNGPGVYIFRTALTLNATANAIVALTNGATAANVFWLPVGPTTLGANGAFKGSILGKSAAITVGDNTTLLNGRVLSGAAVTLRNNQIAK
jgi:ribosomal protein L21E